MKNGKAYFELLESSAMSLGAFRAKVIDASLIETDIIFRSMCESNACGNYGRCWMCPPYVEDIDKLSASLTEFDHVLVYQTVTEIEDSFDIEGMMEARKKCYPLANSLRELFDNDRISKVLHLGVGGCGVCEACAKLINEPCRHPNLAMSSLEAYGVNVSMLARTAEMRYINGQNTVTYFGAVLFSMDGDDNE